MSIAWQDLVFAIGGFIFAPSLIGMLKAGIRERRRAAPLSASIPTASVLWAFAVADLSLGFYLATFATILTAIMWTLLIIDWGRGKHKSVIALTPAMTIIPFYNCENCKHEDDEHMIYPDGMWCFKCANYHQWNVP